MWLAETSASQQVGAVGAATGKTMKNRPTLAALPPPYLQEQNRIMGSRMLVTETCSHGGRVVTARTSPLCRAPLPKWERVSLKRPRSRDGHAFAAFRRPVRRAGVLQKRADGTLTLRIRCAGTTRCRPLPMSEGSRALQVKKQNKTKTTTTTKNAPSA